MYYNDGRQSIGNVGVIHTNADGALKTKPKEEGMQEGPSFDDLKLLAHELLDAIKKEDAMGMVHAFRAMWYACEMAEPEHGGEGGY